MLTFFRRLRQSLLPSGATRKYILYAAGEVLLIMVGILLALQVNNWNENRKARKMEDYLLTELKESIEENKRQMQMANEQVLETNISSEIILSFLHGNTEFSDSLTKHFFRVTWTGSTWSSMLSIGGYEMLKNEGFNLIVNDSLREEIIFHYENALPLMKLHFQNRERSSYFDDYMQKNFYIDEELEGMVPFEYQRLLSDRYYYSCMTTFRSERKSLSRLLKSYINKCDNLLLLIKDELGEE